MIDTVAVEDRGYTPNELAKLLRVSPDRVRAWIRSGEMAAINTSSVRCAKPRFVVLPGQLAAWQERHLAATPAKPAPRRRRQRKGLVDYYP